MLKFELKDALQSYEAKTGVRLTYEDMANMIGVSVDTVKSLATRSDYNASFKLISDIAKSLGVNPISFFKWDKNE